MKKFRIVMLIALALTLVFALCACSHEHQYVTQVKTPATCTEPGISYGVCSLCGATSEEKEIPPLGHDFEKDGEGDPIWIFDGERHWHKCLRTECGLEVGGAKHDLNEDFECKECSYAKFEYEKEGEDYKLTKYNGGEEDVTIPATYKGKAVVEIGEGVFSLDTTIKSVSIPASVKSIGRDAFSGASSLTSVKAASLAAWLGITFENYAANPMHVASEIYFSDAKFDGALNIPAGTEEIKEYTFYGFNMLTSVTIPSSVTKIGYRAFKDALKAETDVKVNITDLEKWCGIIFSEGRVDVDNCYANPLSLGATLVLNNVALTEALDLANIEKIGAYAFFGYDKITSVNCGEAEMGEYAFANCAELKSAEVSAAKLPKGLFEGCAKLDNVTLENTAEIGMSAFASCSTLANITLPATLTTIGERAFEECISLKTVGGAEALEKVGEAAFYHTGLFDGETFGQVRVGNVFVGIKGKVPTEGESAGVLEIEEGVKVIADGALSNVASLKSVKLPTSLEKIGKNAMKYTGLVVSVIESVELGGTKEIGESAFAGNARLVRIQLTSSLEKIGKNAFEGCSALKEVYAENESVLLGIEFENAQANPLSLSKALYLGTYDAATKLTATTLITIPDGTTQIGAYAFSGLSNVASVVLPTSLKTICKGAFEGCSGVRNVYFAGTTQEGFEEIAIEDGYIGSTSAKVYCFSETRPEKDESNFWNYQEGVPTRWNNISKA